MSLLLFVFYSLCALSIVAAIACLWAYIEADKDYKDRDLKYYIENTKVTIWVWTFISVMLAISLWLSISYNLSREEINDLRVPLYEMQKIAYRTWESWSWNTELMSYMIGSNTLNLNKNTIDRLEQEKEEERQAELAKIEEAKKFLLEKWALSGDCLTWSLPTK